MKIFRSTSPIAILLVITVSMPLVSCAPALPTCADLVQWQGEGVRILTAEQAPEADTAHCKVTGVADDTINFELLLPDEWNSKFLMGGGGGFVGSVQNQALGMSVGGAAVLAAGFATVGTDTGHSAGGTDASWALDDPVAEENFAHRAVHRTADVSKAILTDYYGAAASRSYFAGCSRGGGQAMISAQRYPDDFDGILALAPAMDWTGIGAGMIQTQQAIYPDPNDLSAPLITGDNRALLGRELLAACDADDGVEDGVIDDPRRCAFRPDELPRCAAGAPAPDCVTESQLGAIQAIYDGPTVAGERVFRGFPYGGENDPGGWNVWITGRENAMGPGTPSLHFAFGTQMYKYLVFDDPDFDYSSYDFANWQADTAVAAELLNSTDPDIGAFRDRGGKLIVAHGWSDPALTALASVDYYEAAEAIDAGLRNHFRLFMMPGVLHCAGGPGPDNVDWITPLVDWVENDVAPERLLATKVNPDGTAVRSRPLCPYPQVAIYDGTGDPDDAASFACGERRRP